MNNQEFYDYLLRFRDKLKARGSEELSEIASREKRAGKRGSELTIDTNSGARPPSVTLGYDVGSRLITINNASATISRTCFNDELLKSETQTATDGVATGLPLRFHVIRSPTSTVGVTN